LARQTVLLVDADPRSARVFEVSLRNAGYSVTHVQSATEAVEAIEVAIPDLVISDTRLAPSKVLEGGTPLNDGYSLCRRLKDDPVWYAIPFIFLTSSASIEDKIRGLELGVEDFLTKPIYLREIITRIQLVLAKKQREGMEGRTSRASFTGLLSEMGLVDLLSTIDLGRKSGVLELEAPQGRGLVFFRDGRVVDAKINKISGASAVYRMLLWTDGRFEIRFGPCSANEVIEMSTQGLLMEGMRRIDEWQRMREQLPPLDSVFEVDVPEVLARIGEIPDEINPILRAFDGKRTLMEVVDESAIDDLEALATLTKLFFEGLIVPAQTSSGTTTDTRVALQDDRKRDTLIGFDTDVQSSLPPPIPDERHDDVVLPASSPTNVLSPATADEGAASNGALTEASPSPRAFDGTGAAILPDPPSAPLERGSSISQEPAVAKQRGKNRRSKREFADSTAAKSTASTASSSVAPATASTAPVIDDSDDEDVAVRAETAKSAPAESAETKESDASGSQPAVSESAAAKAPDAPAAAVEPAQASSAAVEAPKSDASKPEAPKGDDEKIEISSLADAAKAEPTQKQDAASEQATADAVKTDAARSDESKTEGGTIIQFPRSPRGDEAKAPSGDEKKADEKKADEKKADEKKADEKKADDKKADEKKADEKKPDEKKADEKKADDKKADAKKDPKKSESKRERKDSHGDLGEEAKAFFSDNSFEVAYKRTHDTFEDLKPEAHPEASSNKKLMYVTVSLFVAIVAVVGSLAIYKKFWGVEDAQLSQSGSLLGSGSGNSSSNNSGSSTSGAGASTEDSGVAATTTSSADDSAVAANTSASSDDSGATVASQSADDAAASASSEDAAATASNATPSQEDAATASNTSPATTDSGVSTASSNAGTGAEDSGVAAAPSGPEELLVAAQRAERRGAAAAATAYQAYLDAGGNNAAAIARFAYSLANRGDLGRAGDWAERATRLDPNNQLGWYVLGAAKMEGPRRDPAAARAAFRRCAALPGRYAADCRAM